MKAKYPDVDVEAVDFGSLSFAEQLRVARQTDVLAGIHGAGLTHTMFLREGATAVVEILPADMVDNYMGFRNMANMRGVGYFRTHAIPVGTEPSGGDRGNEPQHQGESNEGREKEQEKGQDGSDTPAALTNDSAVSVAPKAKRASWHREDFHIDADAFVEAIGAAIQSLYNKNRHEHDVVV